MKRLLIVTVASCLISSTQAASAHGFGHGWRHDSFPHYRHGYSHYSHRSRAHLRARRGHFSVGIGLDLTPLLFGHRRIHRDSGYHQRPDLTRPHREPKHRHSALPVTTSERCVETREFQTEIVIDGNVEKAFGTVCKRAGGNWQLVR